jgi:hypothetical protein
MDRGEKSGGVRIPKSGIVLCYADTELGASDNGRYQHVGGGEKMKRLARYRMFNEIGYTLGLLRGGLKPEIMLAQRLIFVLWEKILKHYCWIITRLLFELFP